MNRDGETSARLLELTQRVEELEKKQPVPYHEVVEALMLMAWQYLERSDGTIDHAFMSAGEHTEEVLERLGIINNGIILDKFKDDDGAIERHLINQPT